MMKSKISDLRVSTVPKEMNLGSDLSLTRKLLRNTKLIMAHFGFLKGHIALLLSKEMMGECSHMICLLEILN